MTDNEARRLRVRAQLLDEPRDDKDTAAIVRHMCGLQAQLMSATSLAVRARSSKTIQSDFEHARLRERSIVRVWAMRGSLHVVPTRDVGWLLGLLGPIHAVNARRWKELALNEKTWKTTASILKESLGEGPLTRRELVGRLALGGVDASGQRAPHLLHRAAMEGMICQGPDRSGQPGYVLLSDWVDIGEALEPGAAGTQLVDRYLTAHGPARPHDFAQWSGLPLHDARAAFSSLAEELIEVIVAQRPAWIHRDGLSLEEGSRGSVHLLGHFDPYLLGWRERELVLRPRHAGKIHSGGGYVMPAVEVDGQIVGTWRQQRRSGRVEIVVQTFGRLSKAVDGRLEAEAADLARFLGVPTSLKVGGGA